MTSEGGTIFLNKSHGGVGMTKQKFIIGIGATIAVVGILSWVRLVVAKAFRPGKDSR